MPIKKETNKIDEIIALAGRRGFFFQSCEIYPDSSSGFFDYGPLGVSLKNRIIKLWRKMLVKRDKMIEIDGSQIMSKSVFEASGHLKSFSDPFVKCEKCKFISRADKLIEEKTGKAIPEKLNDEEYDELIKKNNILCPKCKSRLGKTKRWNMMFKVGVGAENNEAFLRPETCQSIYVDFPRLFATTRIKLPIGIAQIGKSFRNEISPRQSLLRMREFTQGEIEIFFNPKKTAAENFSEVNDYELQISANKKIQSISVKNAVSKKIISNEMIAYYLALLQQFFEALGIDKKKMRFRPLGDDEKAFYAKEAWDFEVETSLGWVELVACNNRSDYDLNAHAKQSKHNFEVMDENEKVLPHIFELSMGIDRIIYTLLDLSFDKEKVDNEERIVLKFKPLTAPIQVAVFPLVNKDGLPEIAKKIYSDLIDFDISYDSSGSIGKMYRRQDEIGTPFCITVDHQTKEDKTVTLRERDSMKQVRIKIDRLKEELDKRLGK